MNHDLFVKMFVRRFHENLCLHMLSEWDPLPLSHYDWLTTRKVFSVWKHECEHFQRITTKHHSVHHRLYSFKYSAQFMDHLCNSLMVLSCTFWSLSARGHFVLSPYGKQQCDNSAKHLLLCSPDERMSYKVTGMTCGVKYIFIFGQLFVNCAFHCVSKKCFLRTSTEVDDVEGNCGFRRPLKSIISTIFWSVPGCYVCFSSPAVPPPVCKQISNRSLWGQSALCHLQTSQALQRGQPRCSHWCQKTKKFQH